MLMMTKHNNIGKFNMIFDTLEDLVPEDHIIRTYDTAIDWAFIYPLVEHLYSKEGKPSIDPIVLFKMVFLNYIEGIHSLRKTCERCNTDVAYRWFLRINFGDKIPDHSTFSQNLRRKFLETNLFKNIFTEIVKQAYDAGFIDPENVFGDSTHVKANANKKKHIDQVIKATENLYYEDLKKDINKDRVDHNKKEIDFKDDDDDKPNGNNTAPCDDKLIKESEEDELVDSYEDENGNSVSEIRFDAETGEVIEKDKNYKFKHIKVSTVDPDAGFYHKGEHEKIFAYSASALCDKNGFILDSYITSGNIHDSISFKGLYDSFKRNFLHKKTKLVCLDNGYTSPAVAKMVIDDGKKILTPYKRPMTKDGFFKKSEYVFDEHLGGYICPNNQVLKYSTTNRDGYREFKSNGKQCTSCPYLSQCTKSKNHVKVITEHVWSNYLEEATETRYQIGSKDIYAQRKETIERCFADGKENFGLRFTRYKGLKRVTQSLLLLFACMNFKKMAKWKAMMA